VGDDIWIASLEEKLVGKAALFYKTKPKPEKLDAFIKLLEEKYASPTALAEFKEKLEGIVQSSSQSCEDYLSLKIAFMNILPSLTEAEKLIIAKKGLLPEYRSQVVAADSLEKLVTFALEIDRNKPPESVSAFQKRKKKFGGNCFYCNIPGHREAECRKKKRDEASKAKSHNNGGRSNFRNRLNALEEQAETVQILDVPPTN
jgi:hypothetical protein